MNSAIEQGKDYNTIKILIQLVSRYDHVITGKYFFTVIKLNYCYYIYLKLLVYNLHVLGGRSAHTNVYTLNYIYFKNVTT